MRRRLLVISALVGLAVAGTAIAQSGSDPYELPEPKVRDGAVLRLAAASGCERDRLVRVRFTPPAGAVFGWFEVRVRGREMVRMTGVPRAASTTVRLPRGRSTVRVEGETLGGQRISSARTYRTCVPPAQSPPAPPPAPRPIEQGGGED
jgi:hypothetical protein